MINKFPATCVECGQAVPVGQGSTVKINGKWTTVHADECPAPVVAHLITVAPVDMDDVSYDAWRDHLAAVDAVTEPGMYRLPDGNLAKVVVAKTSGKPYAKRLVVLQGESKGTFEYEAGLIRRLSNADRLSVDEAAAFGHKYGMCCVCGATLTDPKSIAAGIGPVCAGRV